jgi:amphiphysin
MSWNPLRKFSSGGVKGTGAGSSQMGSNSSVVPKDSEDMEKQLMRLTAAETSTNKLKRDAKKLNESIIALNRIDCKLTNDLSNSTLCQEHEPHLRLLTEEWHTFNYQSTKCADDLSVNVHRIIVDPVKKLQQSYKEIRVLLKKRDHLHQEIVGLTAKVSKLAEKEKTGPNLVKLEQGKTALAAAQEEFTKQNNLIEAELPDFVDARIDFFQPSLEGFVRSEALFWGDTLNAMNSSQYLSSIINERAPNWDAYTQQQEKLMNTLSSLSIVEGNL